MGDPLSTAASHRALGPPRGQRGSGPHMVHGGGKSAAWPPGCLGQTKTEVLFCLFLKQEGILPKSFLFLTTAAPWESDLMGEDVETVFGAGVYTPPLLPCKALRMGSLSADSPPTACLQLSSWQVNREDSEVQPVAQGEADFCRQRGGAQYRLGNGEM